MSHLTQVDPSILAPIVIGLLTIFGRGKKKDEKGDEEQPEQASTAQKTAEEISGPAPSPSPNPYNSGNYSNPPSTATEESPLNKLLQSLLQDMPFNPPPENESSTRGPTSTPDWVPPRANPPSRPMVIVPGSKFLTPVEPEQPAPPVKAPKLVEPEQKPALQVAKPTPPPLQKVEQVEQEVRKPARPEKPERQEVKPEISRVPTGTGQSFEHIFDLTQGALKAPGLVIINGPSGSGKTSLSANLAGSYLKAGTPCLLVTYDQSPSSLRDRIKQTGWDAGQYESQFRLLLVDGFSSQSDSLSFEPYCVDRPFDMDSVVEALTRNSQMFVGDKVGIVFDSLTGLASQASPKEFLSKFRDLADKLKASGATLVVTVDLSKLSKDTTSPLEDLATCVIDLQKDGQNGGRLKVRKLNGSVTKSDPEDFEVEPGKGLLFV